MFKCVKCGYLFGDGEEKRWNEPWGESFSGCPKCGGEYEEAKQCEFCGSYDLRENFINGVCGNCIDDCKYDLETCYKIGEEYKENIEINSFLFEMFGGAEEIEAFLYHELKKLKDVDCTPFIESDKWWFAERLAEVLENETK